jgi:hypothetical protein
MRQVSTIRKSTRRTFLRYWTGFTAGLVVTSACTWPGTPGEPEVPKTNAQPKGVNESQPATEPKPTNLPGWRFTPAQGQTWENAPIQGYAGQVSVNRGEPVDLFVSTRQAHYDLEVYRMGWYGGSGGRLMHEARGLSGQNQPIPAPAPHTGLVSADWKRSYTVQTRADWASGAYLVKLIAADNSASYIFFVVRDDSATSDIMYVLAVSTYQVYNSWGGKSLYDFNSTGGRASKVSYDRPYVGNGAEQFFWGDYHMITWMESQGYNVTYATSVDLHTRPDLLRGHKVYLSNFHDEYWSRPMREQVTAARDAGVHLAFFDTNNVWWQIRYEPSPDGRPDRVQVCYKDANSDPIRTTNPRLTTVKWLDPPVGEPPNALLGIMQESSWDDWNVAYPWIVKNASHWIYEGTGLREGDSIPRVVGYEYDRLYDNGLTPPTLTLLAASPVVDLNGRSRIAHSAIYSAPSGALVFSAGTNFWAWKLLGNPWRNNYEADERIQRMTVNVLAKMGAMAAGAEVSASLRPELVIFEDSLAPDWVTNWSWDAKVEPSVSGQVYAGMQALSFEVTNGFGALVLTSRDPMDSRGFAALRFSALASQPGQRVQVYAGGSDNTRYGDPVPLARYGGDPTTGAWKVYTIPLSDLQAADKPIKLFAMQDRTGTPQPPMFIDEVKLIPQG